MKREFQARATGARAAAMGAGARGFTLLEVMIVLVIILLIAGLVTVNLMGTSDKALIKTTQVQLTSLKNGLDLFKLEYSRYPVEEEGIAVLWDKSRLDPEADQTKWYQFMKEPLPKDKWGTEWVYRTETEDGSPFELMSAGPDKEEGTEDDIKLPSAGGTGDDDRMMGPVDFGSGSGARGG